MTTDTRVSKNTPTSKRYSAAQCITLHQRFWCGGRSSRDVDCGDFAIGIQGCVAICDSFVGYHLNALRRRVNGICIVGRALGATVHIVLHDHEEGAGGGGFAHSFPPSDLTHERDFRKLLGGLRSDVESRVELQRVEAKEAFVGRGVVALGWHRPVHAVREIGVVELVARLDADLDFQFIWIANRDWRNTAFEKHHPETGGIATFEAQGGNRAALAGSLDELEGLKIDVEVHAHACLSTGSHCRPFAQRAALGSETCLGIDETTALGTCPVRSQLVA